MEKSKFIPAEEFQCELNKSLEAITEMMNDNISEEDVKETILNGMKRPSERRYLDIYQYEVIVVIADSEPCHFYVVTAWKTSNRKPSYKNKPYRKRRYMRRRKEGKACSRCGKAHLEYGTYPLEIAGKVHGKLEGYGCPNCHIVYYNEMSSEKIKAIIKKLDRPLIEPEELCLVLLYASKEPIKGSISFMKEAFLLFKEKLTEYKVPALSPHFFPYSYGPYSFDIVEAWYQLEATGLLTTEGRRSSSKETFYLTKKGKTEAKKIYESLPNELKKELPNWRRGLDELGNDGILKLVYSKYKEYTDKSKIKDKVLPRDMHGRA